MKNNLSKYYLQLAFFIVLIFGAIGNNYAHEIETLDLEISVEKGAVASESFKAWKLLDDAGAGAIKTDIFWLSKVDELLTSGMSQVKVNNLIAEVKSGTLLTSSLAGQPILTTTLKEGFESGVINVKAWEKINDGIPSLQNEPSKYFHYLRRMSKYAGEVADGSVVNYYRVQTQHAGSHILDVNPNTGNLIFNNSSGALNISTDTRLHADYYFAQKVADGDIPYIIEFKVPKSLDVDIKTAAIPQYNSTANALNGDGLLPKIVDPNQPGDPFELTSLYHNLILLEYIEGSAKILP